MRKERALYQGIYAANFCGTHIQNLEALKPNLRQIRAYFPDTELHVQSK